MNKALPAVLIFALLGAGGYWWFSQQQAAPVEDITVVTPKPQPALPPAPVLTQSTSTAPAGAAPAAPESDALALGEEEVDRIKAETADLQARAADLEAQVRDGEMLLDAQTKKIAKLEAELRQMGVKPAPAKKH